MKALEISLEKIRKPDKRVGEEGEREIQRERARQRETHTHRVREIDKEKVCERVRER